MLTVHTENPLPAKVMQAGAAGYLSKGAAPQEVVSAIRSVYSGQRYIASDIAQQMAFGFAGTYSLLRRRNDYA